MSTTVSTTGKWLEKFHEGECLKVLEGHEDDVLSLAITSDGTTLISGSADNSIRVWNTTDWDDIKTLDGHQKKKFIAFM